MGEGPISVRWPDMSDKTLPLIPWWIGCRTMGPARKPIIYWSPVEERINEELNAYVDLDSWGLAAAGVDHVQVSLSRQGLGFASSGWQGLQSGVAMYELEIPDPIAESHDLAQVMSHLRKAVEKALDEIGNRLKIGPAILKQLGSGRDVDFDAGSTSDRVVSIANSWTGSGSLMLLAPHFAHRPAASRVASVLEEARLDTLPDWRVFSVDPIWEKTIDWLSSEVMDFSGIMAPAHLGSLIVDRRNVAFLIDCPQSGDSTASLESHASYVSLSVGFQARVLGNDGGYRWAALGMHRPAAAG